MAEQPHFLIGDVYVGLARSFSRTVSEDDLQATMRLTGDHGGYHTDPDFARAAGFRTVILPGLLQAGMITRLGGEMNFLARETVFRYLKPVYVGDVLTCTVTVTAVQPERHRMEVHGDVVNQHGEQVLTMDGYGYLPRADWGIPRKPAPAE
jgi:3-hydroxybutyryl-CoA dehydratase